MLAMIEIPYNSQSKFAELPRDAYEEIRQQIPPLNLSEWPEENEKAPPIYLYDKKLIDLQTDGMLLTKHGISFEVKNFKDSYKVANQEPGASYHLHVAIPNIGLLAIDEVMVLEDACTDNLQRYLDEKWRIVAVCPPNSVRRPDYILGRTKSP